MENNIYKMELHDNITPTSEMQIYRVPGGWVYRFWKVEQTEGGTGQWSENYRIDSVFVPYDNEFDPKRHGKK